MNDTDMINYQLELEIIFNSTQDAMFLVKVENSEFRYIRNNAAHQKLAGFSQEDIRDKTPVEAVGEEMGRILISGYKRCYDAKKPVIYEETLPFPAGTKTWLTSLTPVLENGTVKYLVGSRKDITLQKKAERERDELFKRLNAMFNGHNAIMLLIDPVTEKIAEANPAACAFYGYSKEELLSMHMHDLNTLSSEETVNLWLHASNENQRYFIYPHRMKNGEIKLVDVYSCPITFEGKSLVFSIICDASEREKYKLDYFKEKELFKTTLLSIGDGVVTTDQDGKILVLNKAAEDITGWKENEVKGLTVSEVFNLVSEDTGMRVDDPVNRVLEMGAITGIPGNTLLIDKNGIIKPIADSAAPIKDDMGNVLGAVMVFRDATEEKTWQSKILDISYHDVLTGLYNRRFYEDKHEISDIKKLPLAVIIADVNGLKLANDVFGHEEGDRILKKTAEILKLCLRKDDTIFRWGGDEFLILMPNTSVGDAEEVIKEIKNRCKQVKDTKTQLSIAMGCSVITGSAENLNSAVKEAEERMYRQKLMEGKSYRNALVSTLLATLFAKSMETEEHAERLKTYCLAIGNKLGLSIKELDELSLLAVLHDIGKVGISESVLQKTGKLTPDDWDEIRKHPEIGYRIAQNTHELSTISEYILYHHERWDGRGYPRGLEANNIPLLCRILAVTDAFDAMTSDRSYRKAPGWSYAIEEIKRNSGSQFDPYIVDIFLSVYENSKPN